jgi:molybdopterin-guanine dinucleotide biosynthesis protein A
VTPAVVILAGGDGTRIGGAKPLRQLGGKRLIDRAIESARLWSDVLGVAVRDPAQAGEIDVPRIIDDPSIEGPLGGLSAALGFAQDLGCDYLLTIAADMPFLPAGLGSRLWAEIGDSRAAIAASGGELHPVCGLWSVTVLDALPRYLGTGRRSLKGFAEAVGLRAVEWPIELFDPFFNINSPADLATAERLLAA